MGKCSSVIREVRFVLEDDLTQCFVLTDAIGDCPMGVQGWHHKTFSASKTATDILQSKDFAEHLLWGQEAP